MPTLYTYIYIFVHGKVFWNGNDFIICRCAALDTNNTGIKYILLKYNNVYAINTYSEFL